MTQTIQAYGASTLGSPIQAMSIQRRELLEHDIEIDLHYCGICHSDLHQVKNDFGGTMFPIVPGHEMVGKVSRVGSAVTQFKVGDLAAVGCIVGSCQQCEYCQTGLEPFCDQGVTYSFNSPDKYLGHATYGGFSESIVVSEEYALHLPAELDLASSAPLLCAGITVYSPLRHWEAGPGKKVGVLGLGGLGHLAVKIAKAMGAEVTVFTQSANKLEDALKLGADKVVLSSDPEQMKACARQLHLILDTVSAKHDVNAYLNLLKHDGTVVLVGLPPEALEIGAFNVVMGRRSFAGSNIGGIAETQEMLEFCAKHQITAEIELIQADQINVAFERLEKNDVKYRFVVDLAGLKN